VAITAINANAAYVVLMAELNRLFARHPRLRHVRGSLDTQYQKQQTYSDEEPAKYTQFGDSIGAGMKNLHRFLNPERRE
jgi:hypothetical protein